MKTLKRTRKHFSFDFSSAFYNFSSLINYDADLYQDFSHPQGSTGSCPLVIGVDEVGRGCVAGPIYTAAYSCFDFYARSQKLLKTISYFEKIFDEIDDAEDIYALLQLNDSKKVAHNYRAKLCHSLLNIPSDDNAGHIFHSTASKSASKVDKDGIIECLWQCLTKNIADITENHKNFYQELPSTIIILVDGRHCIPDIKARLSKHIGIKELEQISIQQKNIIKGDCHSALIAAASNIAKNARDQYMKNKNDDSYGWNTNVGYGTKKHLEAIQQKGLTKEHRKTFLSKYQTN